MVYSQITKTIGVSTNVKNIIYGTPANGTITLARALGTTHAQDIEEGAVNLEVNLNSGYGYTRSDLNGCYTLNGIVNSLDITFSKRKDQIPHDEKADELYHVKIDCSKLNGADRYAILHYDDRDQHHPGNVTITRALDNYCRTEANQKLNDLYAARGGHTRESSKHVDHRV